MNQSQALSLAKKFKQSLLEAGVPLQSVVVFGSVARNEMHDDSDIDVAVVGNAFLSDRTEESKVVWRARRPISYKIQPLWFYPEQMEDKYSTLAAEIKKDGIEV